MNPSKPRRPYTLEFKVQAIELLAIGRPVTELAAELCTSANLLYSWINIAQPALVDSDGENAAADNLRSMQREVTLLRQKNDILKKATVILGTKPQLNYGK